MPYQSRISRGFDSVLLKTTTNMSMLQRPIVVNRVGKSMTLLKLKEKKKNSNFSLKLQFTLWPTH